MLAKATKDDVDIEWMGNSIFDASEAEVRFEFSLRTRVGAGRSGLLQEVLQPSYQVNRVAKSCYKSGNGSLIKRFHRYWWVSAKFGPKVFDQNNLQ
jgi:hypothetical protein